MSAPSDLEAESPAALTTISDAYIRESCLGVAGLINDLVQWGAYEPHGDPAAIDSTYASLIFPAPLSYSHQLIRYYLEGVRDGLIALSRVFTQDITVHVPTAVLSRQVIEYSASAHYLSDPDDTPEMRLAKMLSIYKPSLVKRTLKAPQVHGLYSAANRLLNDWQSTTSLPSATPPFGSITDAVAVLLSSFAERKVSEGSYRRLCGFAHASPRDITELYELTWRESAQMNAVRYAEAVGDIAVGLRSVCAATLRVYRLRVPPSELDHKLLGIRIQHFGLVIDEITARLGAFWKTVPQLMEQAYASRGMESPRLEDLFDDMSDDGEDETD